MRFNIFPHRSAKERTSETKSAIATCASFGAVALVGLGLFFFGGNVPPHGNSIWGTIRWVGLVIGAFSAYLAVQSLFEAAIAATIGPERAIALMVVLLAIGALFGWLTAT
ncbi:hypothetical protein J3U99_22825 [Brucella pituitosa]|uniref:hypothetical protein n=1 Tax=Brucella pituitosa TaxID=571256 RepID=UPI0020040443|nr:hypothetical protein [Brucella pituitosa]MCK4207586.1 hypothetical protein [Brucella pituitosa]